MPQAEFATEADLVKCFIEALERDRLQSGWTAYHETAGFDILLVHEGGTQIGIEAKLRMIPKVVSQALPKYEWSDEGPDFRAVLVPFKGIGDGWGDICSALGIRMIACGRRPHGLSLRPEFSPDLPNPDKESWYSDRYWTFWNPIRRCKLPEYVPDVVGGKPAPLTLTPWKVKAIKLMIVLDRRGFVTRRDMRGLDISPSYWCANRILEKGGNGKWLKTKWTPDFREQHPENYAQIEADIDEWAKRLDPLDPDLDPGGQGSLL